MRPSSISLTYVISRMGPITERCGTPLMLGSHIGESAARINAKPKNGRFSVHYVQIARNSPVNSLAFFLGSKRCCRVWAAISGGCQTARNFCWGHTLANRLHKLLRIPKMADSPSVTFKSPGIRPCIRLPSRFEAALSSLSRHLGGLPDRA